VRKLPADGPAFLSSVAVMSSDAPLAADEMFEQLMAIKRMMRGKDGGGSVDEKSVEAQRRRGRFKKRRRHIPCQ